MRLRHVPQTLILVLVFWPTCVLFASGWSQNTKPRHPIVLAEFWSDRRPLPRPDIEPSFVNFTILYPDGMAALMQVEMIHPEGGRWTITSARPRGLAFGTWSGETIERVVVHLGVCVPSAVPGYLLDVVYPIERCPSTPMWCYSAAGPRFPTLTVARELLGNYDSEETVLRLVGYDGD
jgi:hypothetical protein